MPEAFPDFDKPPVRPEPEDASPATPAPTAEEVVAPGVSDSPGDSDATTDPGAAQDHGPDPWKTMDPYADPYHSGVTGSGSGHAEREPAAPASEATPSAEDVGLDGTGLSGLMRRWAAGGDASNPAHRTAMGLADHVEAVESRLGGVLGRPLRDRGLDGLARRVERNPLAAVAGALLAGWMVNRLFD